MVGGNQPAPYTMGVVSSVPKASGHIGRTHANPHARARGTVPALWKARGLGTRLVVAVFPQGLRERTCCRGGGRADARGRRRARGMVGGTEPTPMKLGRRSGPAPAGEWAHRPTACQRPRKGNAARSPLVRTARIIVSAPPPGPRECPATASNGQGGCGGNGWLFGTQSLPPPAPDGERRN